jgi:endonuclease G, mitochondrial
MKYFLRSLFFLTSFYVASAFLHAQEVDELIRSKKAQLEEQRVQVDSILLELERLKLQRIVSELKQHLPAPLAQEEIVEHSAMILSYNEEHEQANWVLHMITKDVLYGTTGRTNDFRPDPKLSTVSADVEDYWESGYDRGHLAPSADFRWSREALSESYYYSNMSPQVPGMNRGAWAQLENQVREWAIDAEELIVVTGPILKPDLPKVQQGSFRVSIPEAYFKIVVDLNDEKSKAIAFVIPNKDVPYDLKKYVASIDSIEHLTGIRFFPQLEGRASLSSSSDLSLWPVSVSKLSESPYIKYDKEHVPAPQALYFIGQECNVCGKVVGTRYNKQTSTGITYLNFDLPYPNSPFTAVIFGKDRINFSYEPEVYLKDKIICISGKVQMYQGKPQIVASNEAQIFLYQDQDSK